MRPLRYSQTLSEGKVLRTIMKKKLIKVRFYSTITFIRRLEDSLECYFYAQTLFYKNLSFYVLDKFFPITFFSDCSYGLHKVHAGRINTIRAIFTDICHIVFKICLEIPMRKQILLSIFGCLCNRIKRNMWKSTLFSYYHNEK